MRILIADDEPVARLVLGRTLEKWGHETQVVEDGAAAWKALQAPDSPRLAILDWTMPGLTGPEVCRRLRTLSEPQPHYLVLLTARMETQDIVEGLEAGADEFITKPYNPQELRARIRVGQRVIELQEALAQRERLQGVLEMAGAVCHEFNQPLQVVTGYAELLLLRMEEDDPRGAPLRSIRAAASRIAELTHKVMGITSYRSKDYLPGGTKIIDIEQASATPGGEVGDGR